MTVMQCKLCNQKITSVIIDKDQSYPDCMIKMTKHLTFMHKDELEKFNSTTLPKAIGMFGAYLFMQEYIEYPDQPNIGWIGSNVEKTLNMLLSMLGFDSNEEDGELEGLEEGEILDDAVEISDPPTLRPL